MNTAYLPLNKRISYHGIPVMNILYLLLIIIAPFAGVNLLLLSVVLFLVMRFSGNYVSCCGDVIALYFSFSLLQLISFIGSFVVLPNYSPLPLYIALAAFAIGAVGYNSYSFSDKHFISDLIISDLESRRRKLKEKRFSILRSSVFLALRILAAFFAASWVVYWQNLPVSYNLVFFIAVIGAVTGSLFESIPSEIDKNISVPLSAGMTMWIFEELRYYVPPEKMVLAIIFSFYLGLLAHRVEIADFSAVLSIALLGLLITVFGGLSWFLIWLAFFLLGAGFTMYKYEYKKFIGIAQSKKVIPSYENVFSNSTAALILAVAYGIFPEHSLSTIYAYLGTVATATGNALAREIGTTSKGRPRIITTLKLAKPSDDGAITLLGEIASVFGSAVIGLLAYFLEISDNLLLSVFIATAGGFFGTNIDSVLGATLQKKDLLSNSGVNFLATFAGAGFSLLLYILYLQFEY